MDKQAGKAVAAMYNGGWVKKGNAMAFGNVPEWLERAMEGSRVHAKQFEPISLAADVSQRLLKDRNPAPEFVEAMKAVLEYFEARSAAPKYPAALAQVLSNPLGVLARAVLGRLSPHVIFSKKLKNIFLPISKSMVSLVFLAEFGEGKMAASWM